MADKNVSQNFSENPDPQEKRVSGDDITPSQEQPCHPDRLPQSLIEWLARITGATWRWTGRSRRTQANHSIAAPGMEVTDVSTWIVFRDFIPQLQ